MLLPEDPRERQLILQMLGSALPIGAGAVGTGAGALIGGLAAGPAGAGAGAAVGGSLGAGLGAAGQLGINHIASEQTRKRDEEALGRSERLRLMTDIARAF